jgi:hypothetical protein
MVRTLTMSPRSRLQLWLWAATTLLKHGRPDIVISFLGGLGDDLLCTTAIHEWLQRGAKRIWFISRHPELYRFDSHVRVLPENPALFALARRLKCEPRFLSYSEFDALSDRDTPPPRHLAAEMCARAGLNGRIALRPYLPLTDAELATAAHASGALVVQAAGLDAAVPMKNKQWPASRMQTVIDRFAGRMPVIQIGSAHDPALAGALDLRGKTSLRASAALLARARLFVGTAGFPMHLARAVDCPSVIVYGGREPPSLTGYSCNQNVTRTPVCSPCWQRNRCDFDRVCLEDIAAEDVIAAIEHALSAPRTSLAVDYAEL